MDDSRRVLVGETMRDENEPDQTANNQSHRDEYYYFLQYVHIFSPD
jgi:hypothetical protein